MKDRITLENMAMSWTELAASRSTCRRLHVGSMVFTKDLRRVLSYGYNGNYCDGPNGCDTDEPGNCGCVHSEINALIKCPTEEDMVMFVTDSPCLNCAKCIINAGIKKLYYKNEYRIRGGLALLESKIEVYKIKKKA